MAWRNGSGNRSPNPAVASPPPRCQDGGMIRTSQPPRPSTLAAILSTVVGAAFASPAQETRPSPPATTSRQTNPREASDETTGKAIGNAAAAAANAPNFAATEAYEVRDLRGWTVRVSPDLAASTDLRDAVLELLDNQLFRIVRVVPAPALERLRRVEIWAETEMPRTACITPL